VTEVKNLDVTRDDIRTYTAGVVMVLNQEVTTRLEGETVVIHTDLTAQVDPNEVAQAITALRENESAKNELVALRTEVDQLHQQLDATN
jgi:predicted component of type VI protein secretion system